MHKGDTVIENTTTLGGHTYGWTECVDLINKDKGGRLRPCLSKDGFQACLCLAIELAHHLIRKVRESETDVGNSLESSLNYSQATLPHCITSGPLMQIAWAPDACATARAIKVFPVPTDVTSYVIETTVIRPEYIS